MLFINRYSFHELYEQTKKNWCKILYVPLTKRTYGPILWSFFGYFGA